VGYTDNDYSINEDGILKQYAQELGYYKGEDIDFQSDAFINRLLSAVHAENLKNKSIMALPGEVVSNNDLILTNYYLYNPELPN
jgi:hypothetical protein